MIASAILSTISVSKTVGNIVSTDKFFTQEANICAAINLWSSVICGI
jgi:uridine phosphorylase